MGDLVGQLSDLLGISIESAGLVIAVLALLLMVVGSALLMVTGFGRWARTVESKNSSRLLPTLVEDVLDVDLKRVYRQSLLLDRQVAEGFEGLAEPTGTALGRNARQYVVRLQARRFAACQAGCPNKRGEPPLEEARLKKVAAVLDEALEQLPLDRSAADSEAEAGRLLEEFSARLESDAT